MRVPRFSPPRPVRAFLFVPAVALLFLVAAFPARAERIKVWATLAGKGPVADTLTGRAFEDAPVHAPYLEALRAAGMTVSVALKWQNKVSGWVDAEARDAVAALPFVERVEPLPFKEPIAPPRPGDGAPALPKTGSPASRSAAAADLGEFQAVFAGTGAATLRDTLAARGLRPGEGLRIAVMDADFRLGHDAFDSLYAAGRLVDQYDFVGDTSVAVTRTLGSSHGAGVLSLLAGDRPGLMEGLVPKAEYLLYRTEDEFNELYAEEDYLAAALERAVDSGAQVINISLSYRFDFDGGAPDFPYAQMDGRTRPSSLAALGAARRGALVVVAVGNEGATRGGEPTVTAPGDADSVIAVGMASASQARCSYSSTGPTADGRVKPDLASLGCTVRTANPSTDSGAFNQAGTSVGAPVIAGIAALLRQLHPDSAGGGAQAVRLALVNTAVRAAMPDNQVGTGLVRADQAHCDLTADCTRDRVRAGLLFAPGARGPGDATARDLRGRALDAETAAGIRVLRPDRDRP